MKPSLARNVFYQAYGTPGGEFKSVPRAAIVVDVRYDPALAEDNNDQDETHWQCLLCVLNPTGIFFSTWLPYSTEDKPGTWRWPPRV